VSSLSVPPYVAQTEHIGKFHNASTQYYRAKGDFPAALHSAQTALSLAVSIGAIHQQCTAFGDLAVIRWETGQHSLAQADAEKVQKLSKMSANLHQEALGLHLEACCWFPRGCYTRSIYLLDRASSLLSLCGMSGSSLDQMVMTVQTEVHRLKSEYVEARNIQTQIMDAMSDEGPFNLAAALLNIAQIDVELFTDAYDVQMTLDTLSGILKKIAMPAGLQWHDAIQAALHLREGDLASAMALFEECYALNRVDPECATYCLERLGDVRKWTETSSTSSRWTVIFFVHSLKLQRGLEIHKALQYLGDIFLGREDPETATSLFKLALNGFEQMGVHRSRAECMLRLGDISLLRGDALKAAELWNMAKPLFERSSQEKQVSTIDDRLAGLDHDPSQEVQKESVSRPADMKMNAVNEVRVEESQNAAATQDIEKGRSEDEAAAGPLVV
jgi:tetratricopeptide (TPR) repeat protein